VGDGIRGNIRAAPEKEQRLYLSCMSRFFSSLLVMLLGSAPARGATRSASRAKRLLARAVEGAAERAIEVTVRPRSRAVRTPVQWRGEVIMTAGTQESTVPGMWSLEWQPNAERHQEAGQVPPISDAAAFSAQLTRIVTLREPGAQLRVNHATANGWHTLEVRVPTRPTTVVEFDRDALCQLLGDADARMELRAFT
jgi:hypothetical protein